MSQIFSNYVTNSECKFGFYNRKNGGVFRLGKGKGLSIGMNLKRKTQAI